MREPEDYTYKKSGLFEPSIKGVLPLFQLIVINGVILCSYPEGFQYPQDTYAVSSSCDIRVLPFDLLCTSCCC